MSARSTRVPNERVDATALAVAAAVAAAIPLSQALGVWPAYSPLLAYGGPLALVATTAVLAVRGARLAAAVAVPLLPALAYFYPIVTGGVLDPGPLEAAARTLSYALVFGLPLGLVGYAAGFVVRRI